jgi:predicted flap endonuclease-1-like 5' DNA nuclease
MALLQKLKSMLSDLTGSGDDEDRSRDVGVTVERDATEPATESEAAVKRADTGGSGQAAAQAVETTAESEQAATDADASTGTADSTDEASTASDATPETTADAIDEAETDEAEADESETDESSAADAEAAEATTADAPAAETETAAEADADEPAGDPDLESIKGIGPAYADRLRDAGVETVEQLAEADATALGEATDLSPNRIGNWIDRAQAR